MAEKKDVQQIESDFTLEKLELKGIRWFAKFKIEQTLPKSFHTYRMICELDEAPFLERIEDLKSQLKDSLFEDDPKAKEQVQKQVLSVEKELNNRKDECEYIDFAATVEELKYKDSDTILLVRIPDDVIEAFNRQKSRIGYYKMILEPTSE